CVFWDEGIQSWANGDVDSKVEETSDSVVCHFNHLTNFATLLARDDTGIVNTKALDIVSIVGSSISSFCLLLTILSFVCVPKLRAGGKLRGAVLLVNLSMALLLLNLLLIFSEQSFVYSSPDSCLAVGVLLHFSLLASFAWMTVEAVNLCLVIVTVSTKTVFILSHIWGWFVPSLFVAITCGVDLNLYRRSDEECWMQPDMVLYLVLIPMIIVLTFNFIAYVAVLVASVSANRIRKKSINSGSVKQQVVMSVTLFVLLGITWVFGFGISGTGDSAVVFGYIFAVLNSLQGTAIFYDH
uniref:G-protein coupled receptors family 2 profile 2 domain-containing protein n=1 Tax=Ciona savignyi TaxID=51511 RepID=H2YF53_CIOSA